MERAELAKKLIIPADELESAYVSDFNRKVLLELADSAFAGDVDDCAVETAERQLREFLDEVWSERPDGHKYVINSCLTLAFLFERPMHPQDRVGYVTRIEDGRERYCCPHKRPGTVCDFCAAVPMDRLDG